MLSIRRFLVVGIEGYADAFNMVISVDDLLLKEKNPPEVLITLSDNYFDVLMDMKIGETIHKVQLTRDDKDGVGLVRRLS